MLQASMALRAKVQLMSSLPELTMTHLSTWHLPRLEAIFGAALPFVRGYRLSLSVYSCTSAIVGITHHSPRPVTHPGKRSQVESGLQASRIKIHKTSSGFCGNCPWNSDEKIPRGNTKAISIRHTMSYCSLSNMIAVHDRQQRYRAQLTPTRFNESVTCIGAGSG